MLKLLKFKGNEEDFLFSSDAHINQSCEHWEHPLWHTRGYSSVMEHRRGYINNWNAVSGNDKTCFHVGDALFQDPKGENFRSFVHDLDYKTLYLFLGNHNSGQGTIYKEQLKIQFPNVFDADAEVYPLTWNLTENKTVVFLPEYAEIQINNIFLACCHFPIISHSRMQKSSLHIAGHSHNNCDLTSREKGVGMRIDVGFDAWKRPISLKEIREHLKNREIDARDHHDKSNPSI